ncbi:hypothetical protein D3C71_1744750 [compost metagenome]
MDFAVIQGSISIRGGNKRNCQFTWIDKYLNSALGARLAKVQIYYKGSFYGLRPLFASDIPVGSKGFDFKTREEFLDSLRARAYYDSGINSTGIILVLKGVSDIGLKFIFLSLEEVK